ncbi:MAG: M24 family metallopeptidase, partial [Alphaproteobacteria bacterium]
MSDQLIRAENLVPAAEIENRLARLQKRLRKLELPLAVVTHRVDLYYLTGTMPSGMLVCPAEGEPVFFVRKSLSRTEVESPLTDVRPARGGRFLADYLREVFGEKPARAGIDLDVLAANTYQKLAQGSPQVQWVDTGPVLRELRAVKSAWEIARLEEAARQVEAAWAAAKEQLREGMTELELSVLIEGTMRRMGNSGVIRLRRPGLELVVAHVSSGAAAAAPTAFDGPVGADGLSPASGGGAGLLTIKRGVPVMLDLLGVSHGYTADIARTFCLGEPPDELQRAHEFCREALRRIEDLLTPGTPWGEVYDKVNAWTRERGEPAGFMGYGENRVKFFGHGVGLEVDELPILAMGFAQPLAVGHVIAV